MAVVGRALNRHGRRPPPIAAIAGVAPGPPPSYDADATALFARMTTPPSDTRKGNINDLIVALKNGATSATNIWAKIDALWVLAAADSQAALLNWKGSSFTASAVAAPVFVADRGFTSAGTGSYIETGYNPATAGLGYTQNSAHLSAYVVTAAGVNTNYDITNSATSRVLSRADGASVLNVNGSGGANTSSAAFTARMVLGSRTSSTLLTPYSNGTAGTASTTASSAATSATFTLLGTSAAATNRQLGIASIGAGLSSAEALDFYNAVRTYLAAVGVPGV